MTVLDFENGASANMGDDFSLSMCLGKNLVFLKPEDVVIFKSWLNRVMP